MKKIFMMAMAAGLAFGVSSCNDGPDGGGNGVVDGDATGMSLTIALPGAGATTRAWPDDVVGLAPENDVNTVHVFLFNTDGSQPAYGAYSEVAFSVAPTPNPTFTETALGSNTYTMNGTVEATVGNGMRVYVALNIPTTVAQEFDAAETAETLTETYMLGVFDDIDAMSVVTNATQGNFTMFSPVYVTNLVQTAASNVVSAKVGRITAKVVATLPQTPDFTPVSWSGAPTGTQAFPHVAPIGTAFNVTYAQSHWRVYQDASHSWLASHAGENPPTLKTYTSGASTVSAIRNYVGSWANNRGVFKSLNSQDATAADFTSFAANTFEYIAENASAGSALENNTTYVYISTKVSVGGAVEWDNTTHKITWNSVHDATNNPIPYGNGANGSDIYAIHDYKGNVYLTNKQTKVDDIEDGLYDWGVENENLNIVDQAKYDAIAAGTLPDEVGLEKTVAMYKAEYPEYFVKVYKYPDGFVHFQHFLNKVTAGQYDVLRNQLVHLAISGMDAAKTAPFMFNGNPGQDRTKNYDYDGGDGTGLPYDNNGVPIVADPPTTQPGNPEIGVNPIDIASPNPRDPGGVIDQEMTAMKVNVEVMNWSYRPNEIDLGR